MRESVIKRITSWPAACRSRCMESAFRRSICGEAVGRVGPGSLPFRTTSCGRAWIVRTAHGDDPAGRASWRIGIWLGF